MKILMSKREPVYLGLAVAFYDVDKVRETLTNNLNYPAKSKKVGSEIIFKFPLGMLDRLMLAFPQAHISDGISNYLIKKDQEEFDLLHANPPSISTPNWNSESPLYDFQAVGVAFGSKRLQRDGAFPLTDDMGIGKAQPLETPVLTPKGWMAIGALEVGDKISSVNGGVSEVLGVFDRGAMDVYKITFQDGTSTECSNDHLWKVKTTNHRFRKTEGQVLALSEIRQNLIWGNHNNRKWYIPIVEPVQFRSTKLIWNPYLIGVLLGDGRLGGETPSFTSVDDEIVAKVSDLIPIEMKLTQNGIDYRIVSKKRAKNPLKSWIVENALNVKSGEKFIPQKYLFSSTQDRLELLRGLLDTDGDTNGSIVNFTSKSEKLANDVAFLVRSLGGTARINKTYKKFNYKNGDRGAWFYRVNVAMPQGVNPFKLTRKANQYNLRPKYPPTRSIKSVEYVGKKEVRCIAVSSPDKLYICNDFIVTHNTPTSLALIDDLRAYPALVITTKSGQYKWGREIDKFLQNVSYAIVDGTIAVRKQLIQSKVDILIVSYPQVRLHPELNKIKFEAIIADEFHYIKNPRAQVTKAFHKLQGRYKIGLSGSPMLNGKPEELWSVLKWMYPNRFVKYSDFVKYITMTDGPYGPIAYRNLHKVRDFLKDRNLRRRKAQVLKSLPSTVEMIVEVDLTPDQRRAYNEAKDNMALWLKDGSRKTIAQVMTKSMRLKQICFSPELYGGTESSSKVEEIKKIVEKLDATNQKVIIFSEFSTATRILQRELKQYNPAYVDGSVSAKNRDIEHNRFQNDDSCRIYLGTIGSNKEVIDLFAASYVIFVDRDWTPAYNEQAIARAWRNGQLKQVTVIILVAKDTVELGFETKLLKKSKMNSMMSDRNMVDAGQKISTVIGIEDIESLLVA